MKFRHLLWIMLFSAAYAGAEDSIILPIEPTTAGIFVAAEVNGKHAHLLLDTGSARTVIDHRFAKKAVEIQRVIVNEQNSVQNASIKEVDLQLGDLNLTHWRALILDTAPTSMRAGTIIDGFLGLDVLGKFRSFEIDAKGKTLTLVH